MPVSYSVSRNITFNSWDNFMVPLPFSRATLRIGHPISVPSDADQQQHENKRLELEKILQTLSA